MFAAAVQHEIYDYNNVDYRAFWQETGREYEDAAERLALRRLTAAMQGDTLEIGAGFGRLVDEYAPKCRRVLLTDCTENLLRQAAERVKRLGLDNVTCRRLNLYDLSPADGTFDNVICVRVMHHVEDVPAFFRQVNAVLPPGGQFIFEYANKRNLLEICRWLFRRPNLAPFAYPPSRRGAGVYYNFHPKYIKDALYAGGFVVEDELAVSIFRNRHLKKLFGWQRLAGLEGRLQKPLAHLYPAPSVFVKARKVCDCRGRGEEQDQPYACSDL